MNWNDHKPPHFHAKYNNYNASFDLDGNVIAGYLPIIKIKIFLKVPTLTTGLSLGAMITTLLLKRPMKLARRLARSIIHDRLQGHIRLRRSFVKTLSAKELDQMFDKGEDMTEYIDFDSVEHVNKNFEPVETVSVGFLVWMLEELDKEAGLLAIKRQDVIKTWIFDRIKTQKVV